MKVAYLHGEGDHLLKVDMLECILLMMIPVICRRSYFNQATPPPRSGNPPHSQELNPSQLLLVRPKPDQNKEHELICSVANNSHN
jgi:hypothetical protein